MAQNLLQILRRHLRAVNTIRIESLAISTHDSPEEVLLVLAVMGKVDDLHAMQSLDNVPAMEMTFYNANNRRR